MYLYSKKPHRDQLFHCQSFRIHLIHLMTPIYILVYMALLRTLCRALIFILRLHLMISLSLGEFLVQKNKGKLICDSPNDIISVNFDGEKVDQDGIFYDKDILHFFFESPKHYTY